MLDIDALPHSALLGEAETAEILSIKRETLTTWRHTRKVDIPFCKIGRCVKYRAGDVRQFIQANMQRSSVSEAA